jgi:hypothetical protein
LPAVSEVAVQLLSFLSNAELDLTIFNTDPSGGISPVWTPASLHLGGDQEGTTVSTAHARAARRSGRPEGGDFGHCEPPGSRGDLRPAGGSPWGPRDLNWLHSGGGAQAPGGARERIGRGGWAIYSTSGHPGQWVLI